MKNINENKLTKNAIYNTVYKVLTVFYPLISTAYISRVLSPDNVGKVVFANTLVTYFTTIASLGIPNYGVKLIGKYQNSLEERSRAFIELFIINAVSTVICTVVYAIFIESPFNPAEHSVSLVFGSLLIFNLINIDWFYQGIEEYKFISIRSLCIKVVALLLLFLFVKEKNDFICYTAVLCFATVGNYILNVIKIREKIYLGVTGLRFRIHLKPVFILLASSIATEVYMLLDSTMIGILCSEEDVAYYSAASKLVRVLYTLITAMVAVYLPRLSYFFYRDKREYNKLADQGLKISVIFSVPAAMGIILLAQPIVEIFYGISYFPSVMTVKIMGILICVFSVAYISGHCILISSNNEKGIMYATFCGAIINIILNSLLINKIGYNGAAISSVISELVVTIVLLFNARNAVKYQFLNKFLFEVIGSVFVMGIFVYLSTLIQVNSIFQVLISTVIGVIVYFLNLIYVFKCKFVLTKINGYKKVVNR